MSTTHPHPPYRILTVELLKYNNQIDNVGDRGRKEATETAVAALPPTYGT
jgi:hypothetical protein